MNLGQPTGKITTEEQAIAAVVYLVAETRKARDACDVEIPDDPDTTAKEQVRAYQRWLMLYGQAIGTLIAYHQTSLIRDVAYEQLKVKVTQTLAPRVVGSVIASPHGLQVG